MSEKIEPAMTQREWSVPAYVSDGLIVSHGSSGRTHVQVTIQANHLPTKDLHALAALALHGQPFGFTWEDVDALHESASRLDGFQPTNHRLAGLLCGIADRIASLLPPRETV